MKSGESWRLLALDEVPPIDWRGAGISWRPLRPMLGVDIIGLAAFTAERPAEWRWLSVIKWPAAVADATGV